MKRWILAVLAGLVAVLVWRAVTGAGDVAVDPRLRLAEPVRVSGDGPFLVAIQPWMSERHYQSPAHLMGHLDRYMATALNAGALVPGSVVVFPEHIGTWLVATGAPRRSFTARTSSEAMAWLAAASPVRFATAWLASSERDRMAAALFRMEADVMARDYQAVFSALAERYRVTVVAGSIVLPEPRVENGVLQAGDGPLYNVSAVFHADGRIDDQLVRKVHPIPSEAGFTAAATVADLPVFDTPAGRLGVLVCADSWHPDVYQRLAAGGAELVAVPAFLQADEVWDAPWAGYVTGWPQDVSPDVAGQISEGEAWRRHALGGRLASSGARHGATAFLRGSLWEMGSDGGNILVDRKRSWQAGQPYGAAISVLALSNS
ncbi:nitrilase-related carbon-nitrogen hydrolase [Maricaulis sp. CAU 1757]